MKLTIYYKDYLIKIGPNSIKLSEKVRLPLGKFKTDKKGKEVEKTLGYVKNIPDAIQRIILIETKKKTDIVSLVDFIEKYQAVKNELYDLLK